MNVKYSKVIDNKTVVKEAKDIILYTTKLIENQDTREMEEIEFQTFCPTEEMLLADGWEIYVKKELAAEDLFQRAKMEKLYEINQYDASSEVNIFYVQELPIWLDKSTRVGLKLRFDAEMASGQTNTTLWHEGTPFNLELTNALQMLNAIELYASACYDNTQAHIAKVKVIEDIDDLKAYDYRTGYPEKLRF